MNKKDQILVGLGLGVIGALGLIFFDGKKESISNESNCNDDFLRFDENIKITKSKKRQLDSADRAIKRKLGDYCSSRKNSLPRPFFRKHGSASTGTLIRSAKDTCDYDIGLYFRVKPNMTYESIQKHMQKALSGHAGNVECRQRCVRVHYAGMFHIDITIYVKDEKGHWLLGSKGDIWEECDARLFKDWVEEQCKEKPQLKRIIRYLKVWASNVNKNERLKMPSGLVFTIWAIEHYNGHERDDIAFIQTCKNMLDYLSQNLKLMWTCEMPVKPFDNVLDRLDSSQQRNFHNHLKDLVSIGRIALTEENRASSIQAWIRIFGKRFTVNNEIG